MVAALGRHLALAGFMGAGKSTLGAEVAHRLGRPFVDTDAAVVQESGRSIAELLADGSFRSVEERVAVRALADGEPAVIALGGGAVESPRVRDELRRRAFTVLVEVDVETAWARAADGERPLARDREGFGELFDRRRQLYDDVADARATDGDGVVLAAGAIHVADGARRELAMLVPGSGAVALVADETVVALHGDEVRPALGDRLAAEHALPPGGPAKTRECWGDLVAALRLGRDGTVVALGGGSTTDAAGFAAATYARGVAWVPVPTTLVGQVDAAIGGKTAIDLPHGKNLVGAFHWPVRTVVDPELLATLPERERRNGLAEVVKTGLLAGEPLWELSTSQQVRRCAAFKTAVCLADPTDRGVREQLNLGHTFAHALEAAGGYELPHGEAVALGLLAALRLSGVDTAPVVEVLAPRPVTVDRGRAWDALLRDKKARDGRVRLVLLDAPGRPRTGVVLPEAEVRAALDELIAN